MQVDKKKSFRGNLDAGCSKGDMMQYYSIKTEAEWEKLMKSIKGTRMQEDAKAFRGKRV